MRALVYHAPRRIRLENSDDPECGSDEILIQVSNCGICGSDIHGYLGYSERRTASIPLIMGHELSGRIMETGNRVTGELAVGQRVVVQPQISCGRCRACQSGLANICPKMQILGIERAGGFADFISVPSDRVFPLPDNVSDAQATLVETLAVQVHLFRCMTRPLLRTVAIWGAGAQGLFAVQLARLGGASQVIVTDLDEKRLQLAEEMGATCTVEVGKDDMLQTVLRLSEGWGAELAIDAVGSPAVRKEAAAALAPGGTLGLVGLGKGETTIDFLPVVNRELILRGSYCYTDDDFLRALELISSGQIEVASMINEIPLDEGKACFERLASGASDWTKVVLKI